MTSRPAWSAWSSTRARPSAPFRATWTWPRPRDTPLYPRQDPGYARLVL